MKRKTYQVHLRVTDDNLTTILDVVRNSAQLLKVFEDEREVDEKRKPRQLKIKGIDLAEKTINEAKRPLSPAEIGKQFVARGFSKASHYGPLADLVKAGKIVRHDNGYYGKV